MVQSSGILCQIIKQAFYGKYRNQYGKKEEIYAGLGVYPDDHFCCHSWPPRIKSTNELVDN